MKSILVIGAGLGGLVTAALLANRGHKVTVLERSPILGGRSHVHNKDGFKLPYGAHAILSPKAEPMKSIFKELDIQLDMNKLSMSKFKLFAEGKIISAPFSLGALTTPAIDGFMNHFVFLAKFLQMVKAKPNFDREFTIQNWIDQHIKDPSIAKVIQAYAALTVYDGALDKFSMNAFVELTNIEYSTSQALGYAGFDELFSQLKQSILKQGGEVLVGCNVKELVISEDGTIVGVATSDQTMIADAVVLCLPPQAIEKIVKHKSLYEELSPVFNQSPQYVYVHDVMLSKQLRKDITNILDLDEQVYINDYSLNVAGSAPKGCQLLTSLKFLTEQEQKDDSHTERSQKSVERILDAVYPAWRNHVHGTRIINRAIVNGVARHSGHRLLPLESRCVKSLFFAGDSTVGRGGLGMPSYDSAWSVAELISKPSQTDR